MDRQLLYNYKKDKAWLVKRKDKIQEEYESIQKLSASYEQNARSSSAVQDKLAENISILLDMKKETLDFAIDLEKQLHNIDNKLLKLEQPYRNILTFAYIDGENLVDIASEMQYSYRDICRKHGTALKKWDEL